MYKAKQKNHNKGKLNRLVSRAKRCICFKNWKENVNKINLTVKMLDTENVLK